MRIHVCGRGDVRMPQPFLDLFERKALLEQQGRDRVAQVVEADARQGGPAAHALNSREM